MRIGITGGIACGKSTASRMFEAAGFGRIDCDELVHELLASDQSVISEVSSEFGEAVLADEGGINRRELGRRVFGNPDALKALEGILHPRVRERWESIADAESDKDWVVEIPLLFEKKLENRVDFTVC
ncbi:MAG: dephospho-CoA kinase, partial [Verrucomicrobiota bacterium]